MSSAARDPIDGVLSPGALFADRYQIEELLGRGAMGAVYRARDLSLGETIALKVLVFGPDPPLAAVLRFRQEVRLARRVTHPNVARVFDIGEHEGVIYMTMELIDGMTLRAAIRTQGPFEPARAARITQAIAEGLAAAHAVGVIHRDLKPANVLLDRAGRVAIGDFGVARSMIDAPDLTLGALGTPAYMAPEQRGLGAVGERADLYALGVILAEMFFGTPPRDRSDRLAERLLEAGAPAALSTLAARCLAHDPEARPRSAVEITQIIGQAFPDGSSAAASAGDGDVGDRASYVPSPLSRSPSLSRWTAGLGMEAAGERVIAVLPFRYRGEGAHSYLGEALSDELIDVLSRTRGLRVLGSGATKALGDDRDPARCGRELSAAAIVDGSVQMVGDRVRLSVRLLDVQSGVQLWSDRHDARIGDALQLQESIARRVAEELRVELNTLAHSEGAPDEVLELYLATRRRFHRMDPTMSVDAAADLARCIEMAPRFAPAHAAHAIASVRCWFTTSASQSTVDWEQVARTSVARALERAPDIAESHLAAGLFATHNADFRRAARSLARALSIAPTCAQAHEHLAALQCEAGQGEAGAKRMALAAELDPTLPNPPAYIARNHALHGRYDAAAAALQGLEERGGGPHMYGFAMRMRIAAWRRAEDELRVWTVEQRDRVEAPFWRPLALYIRGFLREISDKEIEVGFARLLADAQNPRFIALIMQIQTELYAGRGEVSAARFHLLRAATSSLIDLEWLDKCPLLAELREDASFVEVRRRVQARASAIWAP